MSDIKESVIGNIKKALARILMNLTKNEMFREYEHII